MKTTYWRWIPGSCNLALLSYVEGNSKTALSLSRWADIYLVGYSLVQACLNLHSQGGAGTVIGKLWAQSLLFFEALSNLARMTQVPMANLCLPCSSGRMGPSSKIRLTSTRAHHFPQALILQPQQYWRCSALLMAAWTPLMARYQKASISVTQLHWYLRIFWTIFQVCLTTQPLAHH